MEVRKITPDEVEAFGIPVNTYDTESDYQWYGVFEKDTCTGFMEIATDGGISEISYLYVPDIYRENGYGKALVLKAASEYLQNDNMLVAMYYKNRPFGEEFTEIFSEMGFDIRSDKTTEYEISFDTLKKTFIKEGAKEYEYKGSFCNFTEGADDVFLSLDSIKDRDSYITKRDILTADLKKSVAAINESGVIDALLLVKRDPDDAFITVSNLYYGAKDPVLLKEFFRFAVENAIQNATDPRSVNFIGINEKIRTMVENMFPDEPRYELYLAEAVFNRERFIKQAEIAEKIGALL